MTRLARFATAVAALPLLLLLLSGPASGQTTQPTAPTQPTQPSPSQPPSTQPPAPPDARWSGGWTVEPDGAYREHPVLSFVFRHLGPQTQPGIERVEVAFTRDGGAEADGCDPAGPAIISAVPQRERGESVLASAFQPRPPCNGRYTLSATAFTGTNSVHRDPEASPPFVLQIALAVPAPPPTSLVVAAQGSEARLRWVPPEPQPPDLVGYLVERSSSGDGQFEPVGDTVEPVFVDATVVGGGAFHYRVRSVRLGADAELVASDASPASSVELAPSSTAATGTGSGGGSTAAGGDRSGFGQVQQQADRLRPGGATVAPPGPRTTIDTGFDQTLPFDPNAPDSSTTQVGPPGDSGLASTSLQTFDDGGGDRKAVLAPVAGGLALLVVFLQLRWLLRQAGAA